MIVMLANRSNNSNDYWFWVPLVGVLRKVPITHYKPETTGGADDILQLEHTGIYKIEYTTYSEYSETELQNTIQSIIELQGKDSVTLDPATLQTAYESFNTLIPLFTACSDGRITSATSGNTILEYSITGWADSAVQTDVLTFAKLNIYNGQSGASSTRIGLLSIPNDTKSVRVINITKMTQNNDDTYSYVELINVTINNTININTTSSPLSYYPNTLNLHLFIGEVSSVRITQQSTYMIDNKTKNVTQHIYPPTTHGYGTTLMPMEKNTVINLMSDFVNSYRSLDNDHGNRLFYDSIL